MRNAGFALWNDLRRTRTRPANPFPEGAERRHARREVFNKTGTPSRTPRSSPSPTAHGTCASLTFTSNLPAAPVVTVRADISDRPARNPTTDLYRFTMLKSEGRAAAAPWALLDDLCESSKPAHPADQTNATGDTNDLKPRYKRTRTAVQTNSTVARNELGLGHKRTRPLAQTNSTPGANELDPRYKRTRPGAQTNSTRGANELGPGRKRTRPGRLTLQKRRRV